jgi:uncharacterized membrane protein
MTKGRLEAFSDGVVAIIITIMVLELAQPEDATFGALHHEWPHFAIYALSFVGLGIYWNNHHHLFHIVDRVNGRVLWSNLHLLFWLSLVPYVTAFVGNQGLTAATTATYSFVHLMAGLSYYLMVLALLGANGPTSRVAGAIGRDRKGKASVILYIVAIGAAFLWAPLSIAINALVAAIWFIPDRRMER